MIDSVISGIVSNLLIETIAPKFYKGFGGSVNKSVNNENDNFIYLKYPFKFKNNQQNDSFNSAYQITLYFLKHTNIDNDIDDKQTVINLLYVLYKDFLKETKNQDYKFENLDGELIIDGILFDNNVSGFIINMTFIIKNEFNIC